MKILAAGRTELEEIEFLESDCKKAADIHTIPPTFLLRPKKARKVEINSCEEIIVAAFGISVLSLSLERYKFGESLLIIDICQPTW